MDTFLSWRQVRLPSQKSQKFIVQTFALQYLQDSRAGFFNFKKYLGIEKQHFSLIWWLWDLKRLTLIFYLNPTSIISHWKKYFLT